MNQQLADRWAGEAQRFVGYWHGVHVTGVQLAETVRVTTEPWVEPLDDSDDCEWCQKLDEAEVYRRILGFQHEMDAEVVRINGTWLHLARHEDGLERITYSDNPETFAHYHELLLDSQTRYADQFRVKKIQMVYDFLALPFYLQRRLCARWNHVLRDWLAENPKWVYDSERREIVTRASGQTEEEEFEATITDEQREAMDALAHMFGAW